MDNLQDKSTLEILEDIIGGFYQSQNKSSVIKTPQAEFMVMPKVFISKELNPEIGKEIIRAFLKKVGKKEIMEERVIITPKKITIFDRNKEPLVQVVGESIINKIGNPMTDEIGKILLNLEKREFYSFGEIRDVLIKFINEKGLANNKNPLKDAIMLLDNRTN